MDISSLRERPEIKELTVSELNSYIKKLLDGDKMLSAITVRGEISNFTYHRTGHLYFTLKDEGGQVKAVMFRSFASTLKFMPENGMKVIVRCSVSLFSQTGTYQLYVNSMQPDGVGALYLAYEQLKAKLDAEGLFDDQYKKLIPRYPSSIGVITSPTGAAVRDIINVISRRFPLASIYLYPSLVQGDDAEKNLIAGLDYFDKAGLVDVIIIGRGGGSIEDLFAFNGEKLARRIFDCNIPIISAVGHETDFTICDFVADLRAPTPSAAAELSVPDYKEIFLRLSSFYDRCVSSLIRKLERSEDRVLNLKDYISNTAPKTLLDAPTELVDELYKRLKQSLNALVDNKSTELVKIAGKLHVLSPLATLSRGYSLVDSDGKNVKSIDNISVGDSVNIRMSDGNAVAEIKEKRKL